MIFYKKAIAFSFLLILYLSSSFTLRAQESILDEISYLYMEKLIAVAKENNPKSKLYANRLNIARNNIASAKTNWLDPLAFAYSFRSNNNNIDLATGSLLLRGYQFGVTISPGSLLKTPFTIKNAKEELKMVNIEKDDYNIVLEAEVKRRYILYLQSQSVLRLVSKNVVDTESSFNYLKGKYEKNEVLFDAFNSASLSLSSARQSKIGAEANFMTAKFSLEELLTKKLEEIK